MIVGPLEVLEKFRVGGWGGWGGGLFNYSVTPLQLELGVRVLSLDFGV